MIRVYSFLPAGPAFDTPAEAIRYTQSLPYDELGELLVEEVQFNDRAVVFKCAGGRRFIVEATESGPSWRLTETDDMAPAPPDAVMISFGQRAAEWDRTAYASRIVGRRLAMIISIGEYVYLYARGLPAIFFSAAKVVGDDSLLLYWQIEDNE
ncbi:MAG TPA: hypothetical protein VD997_04595 [Phycisphaerales bacterium]|nr:hypothetical protein [Phycisphaerales bacterium]